MAGAAAGAVSTNNTSTTAIKKSTNTPIQGKRKADEEAIKLIMANSKISASRNAANGIVKYLSNPTITKGYKRKDDDDLNGL